MRILLKHHRSVIVCLMHQMHFEFFDLTKFWSAKSRSSRQRGVHFSWEEQKNLHTLIRPYEAVFTVKWICDKEFGQLQFGSLDSLR